jgi:redox-sensitive bicupin YhaK (pirin superfamily)
MIHVMRAEARHLTDFGWLKTSWGFAFSAYDDPAHIPCGALRVCNDDVVAPHTGFGTHPHQEMESITVVLDGAITHEDSLGTKAVIRAGEVQRMAAGTGIRHAECNLGEVPAHCYQIWIYPDPRGVPPRYDQQSFAGTVWSNRLVPVASGQGLPDVVTFHTDATLSLGALEAHRSVTHAPNGTRRVFVDITEGGLAVDGTVLHTKDQGRIDAEAPLTLTAHQDTRCVLIDVPSCRGWGYDQATFRGIRSEGARAWRPLIP